MNRWRLGDVRPCVACRSSESIRRRATGWSEVFGRVAYRAYEARLVRVFSYCISDKLRFPIRPKSAILSIRRRAKNWLVKKIRVRKNAPCISAPKEGGGNWRSGSVPPGLSFGISDVLRYTPDLTRAVVILMPYYWHEYADAEGRKSPHNNLLGRHKGCPYNTR